MDVANLPGPDEAKRNLQVSFQNMDVDQLAAAGRAVKKGVEPTEALKKVVIKKKAAAKTEPWVKAVDLFSRRVST
jgi:hypothetical protein